jgi:DNA-binding NarL/FixJ family response regulator
MDFTPRLEALRETHALVTSLLAGRTVVACFGSRTVLTTLLANPYRPELVGGATTEQEGLALVEHHQPALLFVGERLEEGCGLHLAISVKERHPSTLVMLVLSGPGRRPMLRQAVEAGCEGICLEMRLGFGSALEALRAICGGGLYMDKEVRELMASTRRGQGPDPIEALTPRELEVLELMVKGFSNPAIATALTISNETVKTHTSNLRLKLQARDRTHAAVLGLCRGLIHWPHP